MGKQGIELQLVPCRWNQYIPDISQKVLIVEIDTVSGKVIKNIIYYNGIIKKPPAAKPEVF